MNRKQQLKRTIVTYTTVNIETFFQPIEGSSQGNNVVSPLPPCQSPPQVGAPFLDPTVNHVYGIFKQISKDSINVSTITIGDKYLGQKSAIDKYYALINALKAYVREYPNNICLYTFEISSSGALHAHGLDMGYRKAFQNSFGHIGKRNYSSEAYQPCKQKESYLKYIVKDQSPCHQRKFPPFIHEKGVKRA